MGADLEERENKFKKLTEEYEYFLVQIIKNFKRFVKNMKKNL